MRLSVCLSVCMYVYVCMFICLYVYFYICMHVRVCVCVYVYVCPVPFLTSNLLHQESSIYVSLFAYMRTLARQHLKLEVRHRPKNSHGRIHTHTY